MDKNAAILDAIWVDLIEDMYHESYCNALSLASEVLASVLASIFMASAMSRYGKART